MNTRQCEVIQDLLPLYIDKICSDESRHMVSEHLESCDACRRLYENMSKSVEQDAAEPELDSKRAFRAIHYKWKIKKMAIICVSVVLTALVVFSGCMVVQNVSSVHDYFFPVTYVNLRDIPDDDEWHRIRFENSDVLVFDSIFYEKEVTLDGNSDGAVDIRIFDRNGTIVLDERTLQPGKSLDLEVLQRNTEYVVEIKTAAGFLVLRFH